MAKAFQVSLRTVERWAKSGMPKTLEGYYDLIEIQNWRLGKDQEHDEKRKQLRNELLELQIEDLKLQIRKTEGSLIPRDVALKALSDTILSIKQQFFALPEQVTPQIIGLEPLNAAKVKEILILRIKEIICEFAEGKHL